MSKSALSKRFEKEHINIVEIDVPRCVNIHGTSPCTATETGDAKCYNTRSTCNDLANYNELILISSGMSIDASERTINLTSGNWLTSGFLVGQTITTSGFTNESNNYQFIIEALSATIMTLTNNDGLVDEGLGTRTVTAPNIYTYKFCSERSPHPNKMNNVVPCLSNVSIAPSKIDASGGIGARSSVSVTMIDLPASDRNGVDPYLADRTYNPWDVGLYFIKWRARNANYENYNARVLSGYIENNTFEKENFELRGYVIAAMTATNGSAGFKFKDPLQLVSNKKALAPMPSNGTLTSAITNSATSIGLQPSGIGNDEYPTFGIIKIKGEVFTFTRSGDALTVVRGQYNTVATTHDSGDTVQICLNYDGTKSVDLVQADLMINYAKMQPINIPRGAWAAEVGSFLTSNPNRLITDPTPVDDLIGELCEQWTHKLFWGDRVRQVQLVALKAPPAGELNSLTSNKNLLELSVSDQPSMQLSTIFVMYGQFNPTKKIDEKDNYQITASRVNVDAIARYDSNNSVTIYAPWIATGNGAAARRIATLKGRRFGIVPRQIAFALEDKDSLTWLGDVKSILHPDIADQNGNAVATNFEITQASEGDTFTYQALEYNYDEALAQDDALGIEVVDLPIDERNINLLDKYTAIYGAPDASTVAKFIVYSGVVIGSTSVSVASLITGVFPTGAEIQLQINSGGAVVGFAGSGSSSGSTNGTNGFDAISLGFDLTIINNGTIGGGAGGGGAQTAGGYIAAGGGGAGDLAGSAGVNDNTGIGSLNNSTAPQIGTPEAGGSGGLIQYTNAGEPFNLIGGNGGNLGQSGANGSGDGTGSNGGTAGKAVDLNGNTLTQNVSGDIFGAIS
jgi:hypothetical protein